MLINKYNTEKYKNKYRIPSTRLQGYDYGADGCYFVTICTQNRKHYFDIVEMKIAAQKFWLEIPQHFPFVILDEFVVMPNHIHDEIGLNKVRKYIINNPSNWANDKMNCRNF